MQRARQDRLISPALIISVIALFVALGGTSYAVSKLPKNSVSNKQLKKNAVTGSKVKNRSLSGADIKDESLSGTQINEATLGTVPSAAKATDDRIVTFGITAVPAGQDVELVGYGPFKLTGRCTDNAGTYEARVIFSTTEDHTSFAGDDAASGDAGPGTAEASRIIENAGAASATTAHSDGYDDQFSAQAPSGAAWTGTVQSAVDKPAGNCSFSGYILKIH